MWARKHHQVNRLNFPNPRLVRFWWGKFLEFTYLPTLTY